MISFRHPAASSSIEIIKIELGMKLGLPPFAYYNVFITLLNYMQYKLAFTRHIDMYSI